MVKNKIISDHLSKNTTAKVQEMTETSFTITDGNKRNVFVFSGPVNYQDSNGVFQEIDNKLIPSDKEGFQYMNTANRFKAYFRTEGKPLIRIEKGDDYVEMSPSYLQWINDQESSEKIADILETIIPVIDENKVTWMNVFGEGVHLEYRVENIGIFKNVIIDSYGNLTPPTEELLNGSNTMFELCVEFSSNIPHYYKDQKIEQTDKIHSGLFDKTKFKKSDKTVFAFLEPRHKDSGEMDLMISHWSMFPELVPRRFFNDNDKNIVTTRMEQWWLEEAIYPVYCDTDITDYPSANTDDGHEINDSSWTDSTTAIAGKEYTGDPYFTTSVYDVGIRFTAVNIPQGATVDSATMQLYPVSKTGSDANTVLRCFGEDTDDSATFGADARVSQRTPTTASVDFTLSTWANASTGALRQTPSIATIVQEIVNRGSWVANNDMSMFIMEDGCPAEASNYVNFRTYNYGSNYPVLNISYTAASPTAQFMTPNRGYW